MEKRLRIAKELLTEEGVIFISIDDNEQAQLKLLCDEVFGGENFIASITRNTNSSKNQSLYISVSHEYCLVYSKNIYNLNKKHQSKKWEVNKNNIDEYKKRIEKLKKMGLNNEEITSELKKLTNYPRFIDFTNYWYLDNKGIYRKADLGGVKNGNTTPIINPLTGKEDPVPPGGFRYKPEMLKKLISENRIHFHTDGSLPTIKRYLDENSKQRPKSIMSDDQRPDYKLLKDMKIKFDNPKQMTFMTRILSIFEQNSTILDFFAGSGTTGHAVVQLNKEDGGNRKYILCTNNENNICEDVTYKRLSNIQEELPHNLKYYKVDYVSKSDEEVYEKLNEHIQEMVNLEEGKEVKVIYDEEEVEKVLEESPCDSSVYIMGGIMLSGKEQKIVEKKRIKIKEVPEIYYRNELKELGEI